MISRHDEEIISGIADFNTLTLVTTAYTLYENLSTKKPISKRQFYQNLEIIFKVSRKYLLKILTKNNP